MDTSNRININLDSFPSLQEAYKSATPCSAPKMGRKKRSNKSDSELDKRTQHVADSSHLHKIEELRHDSKESLLRKAISNLTPEFQNYFAGELRDKLQSIGGFHSIFSNDNKRYREEGKNLEKTEVRETYRKLRIDEQEKYRLISTDYESFKKIFSERIAFLEGVITKHSFEIQLLNEMIIGNDSYLKSFSFSGLGYKYGATHRLWEITHEKGALETRKANIGLKDDDKPIYMAEIEKDKESFFEQIEIRNQIADLSRKIDILKERVLVSSGALKRVNYDAMVKSDFPKLYYRSNRQQLEAISKKIEDLKSLQEKRIEELNSMIERVKGDPESPHYLGSKQEHAEITKRWEMIDIRLKEVETLLLSRKSYFKLSEDVLNNNEEVKVEILSDECDQALSLLDRITSLKEDIVLGNTWEKWANKEERCANYFLAVRETAALKTEKANFLDNTYSNRLSVLNEAIETYHGYIKDLRQGIQAIDNHFEHLAKDNEERAKWNVNSKV